MCDSGRCLLPVSVCDSHPNCQDQSDEVNCSQSHKDWCNKHITHTPTKNSTFALKPFFIGYNALPSLDF